MKTENGIGIPATRAWPRRLSYAAQTVPATPASSTISSAVRQRRSNLRRSLSMSLLKLRRTDAGAMTSPGASAAQA